MGGEHVDRTRAVGAPDPDRVQVGSGELAVGAALGVAADRCSGVVHAHCTSRHRGGFAGVCIGPRLCGGALHCAAASWVAARMLGTGGRAHDEREMFVEYYSAKANGSREVTQYS